jgi:hypothetical protein
MSNTTFRKDPQATLDYHVDWSTWMEDGDAIIASDWFVADGLTEVVDAFSTTVATVWLSGGTAGQSYTVTNRITTSDGRIDERSITIKAEQR